LAGDPAAAEAELRRDYLALEGMGERNYISTTAGYLAAALCEQGRLEEADGFVQICRDVAAEDDVSSQVLWRGVRSRILRATGDLTAAWSLASEAVALLRASDEPDTEGVALLDLAEVLGAMGRTHEAAMRAAEAAGRFTAKRNVVSARRAERLIQRLHRSVRV